MLLEYTVHNRDELVAAVKAASQPTYEMAKEHPVHICNGSAQYNFKEGIQEARGVHLIANIRTLPKKAFLVTTTKEENGIS